MFQPPQELSSPCPLEVFSPDGKYRENILTHTHLKCHLSDTSLKLTTGHIVLKVSSPTTSCEGRSDLV